MTVKTEKIVKLMEKLNKARYSKDAEVHFYNGRKATTCHCGALVQNGPFVEQESGLEESRLDAIIHNDPMVLGWIKPENFLNSSAKKAAVTALKAFDSIPFEQPVKMTIQEDKVVVEGEAIDLEFKCSIPFKWASTTLRHEIPSIGINPKWLIAILESNAEMITLKVHTRLEEIPHASLQFQLADDVLLVVMPMRLY